MSVRPFTSGDRALWDHFIKDSPNATLFHERAFLAYHPAGRFEEHSLLFFDSERLVALLPAAIRTDGGGERILESPFGASIGGLAFPKRVGTSRARATVRALKAYAAAHSFSAVVLRIPSGLHVGNELQAAALLLEGFELTQGWVSYLLDLRGADEAALLQSASSSKRYDVRAAARSGVVCREVPSPDLAAFLPLFDQTYRRHGTSPTHSHEELRDLFSRLPDRIRVFVAEHGGEPLAGVVCFAITATVAATFYICESDDHRELCAPAALLMWLSGRLAAEGFSTLDFGPSASRLGTNEGVVQFKESLGGRAALRQEWRWRVGPAPGERVIVAER